MTKYIYCLFDLSKPLRDTKFIAYKKKYRDCKFRVKECKKKLNFSVVNILHLLHLMCTLFLQTCPLRCY